MQQHSGQHLISALFEQKYNYFTKSWWLGSDCSFVELDAPNLTQEEIDCIEKEANRIIIDALPVTVKVFDESDPNLSDGVSRSHKDVPSDVSKVRVISIGNIDSNKCCGTHVSNTSQLQMISLLNVEKKKQKVMLNFLVGERVLIRMKESFEREMNLNNLLK